ncbi:MAG: methylmalonyl-CoA mutase [Actinophytocola sp.]|nr:methylmalonyl-CoA mutase [Actinophytocola sp.]
MGTRPTWPAGRGAGRVLVAKLGLDGHDVGAKFIGRLLRDNGFDVVYLGIRRTPEEVVRAAVDEDVDLIGLSMLSGSHGTLVEKVLEQLAAEADDAPPVVLGGVVPDEDHPRLTRLGVRAIFNAGVPTDEMVARIRELVAEQRGGGH